jgi:hypothetical protein
MNAMLKYKRQHECYMDLPSSRTRLRNKADAVPCVRDDATVYLYPYPGLCCDLSFFATFTPTGRARWRVPLACVAASWSPAGANDCTKLIGAKTMRGERIRASATLANWYLVQNACATEETEAVAC